MRSLVVKPAGVSAVGATPLWVPTAGHRFQLLGIVISLAAATVAGGAVEEIVIQDGAINILRVGAYVPAVAVAQAPIVINLPGEGYISAADDNVLNINLSSAVTGGIIEVTAWGYER